MSSSERRSWSVGDVRQLVEGRGGGSGLWQLEGRLIALGTGRQLARLVGVEEVLVSQPVRKLSQSESIQVKQLARTDLDSPNEIHSTQVTVPHVTHDAVMLVRHSLFYTQNDSDSLMQTFRFRPTSPARTVVPVLPPASRVRIARTEDGGASLTRSIVVTDKGKKQNTANGGEKSSDDEVIATAELNVSRDRTIGFGFRRMLCASWGFIGRRVRIASGAPALPGVVEHCDYVLGRRDGVWHWSRVGRCPAWYGRGQCVTYLDARKVPAWHRLDENLRALLTGAGRSPLRSEISNLIDSDPPGTGSENFVASRLERPSQVAVSQDSQARKTDTSSGSITATQAGSQKGDIHRRRRKIFGLI